MTVQVLFVRTAEMYINKRQAEFTLALNNFNVCFSRHDEYDIHAFIIVFTVKIYVCIIVV